MKALVLATRGEPRLHPFTLTRPPALLPVANRPVLEWNLSRLPSTLAEIVIFGSAPSAALREGLGRTEPTAPLRFVESPSSTGIAEIASLLAGMDDAVLLLNGHDVHSAVDLAALAAGPGWLLGAAPFVCGLGAWAPAAPADAMLAAAHIERRTLPRLRAAAVPAGASLPDLLRAAGEPAGATITARDWFPLVYPWHIIEANVAAVRALTGPAIHGRVQENVHIEGNVHIGEGTLIKAGTTIEGPVIIGRNCVIGPSAYVRPDTVIGDDCHLGHAFEIFDSVIFAHTTGKHRSYVGHCVIGRDVNFGAGFISSDYRHDGGKHVTPIAGSKVNTGRSKLGAFIGDGVRTGVHTATYPGRKIWPGLTTLPGEVVKTDRTA